MAKRKPMNKRFYYTTTIIFWAYMLLIPFLIFTGYQCDDTAHTIKKKRNNVTGEIEQPKDQIYGDYILTGNIKPGQSGLYELFSTTLKIVQMDISGNQSSMIKWGVDVRYPQRTVNVGTQQSVPIHTVQDSTFVVEVFNNNTTDYEYTITLTTELK